MDKRSGSLFTSAIGVENWTDAVAGGATASATFVKIDMISMGEVQLMSGQVQAPAPGMQSAMAILTARVQSMDGGCSVNEYVDLLRSEMDGQDALILTSAMASLASALLAIASGGTNIPPYELLSTIGLTLADV